MCGATRDDIFRPNHSCALEVPSITTDAPMSGSLVLESTIEPFIVPFCARIAPEG